MQGVLPGRVSLPAEIHVPPNTHVDAALSRIQAPHLLKQEPLQLAGASFRDVPKCAKSRRGAGGTSSGIKRIA